LLYPNKFKRTGIAALCLKAKRDNFTDAFHRGVEAFCPRPAYLGWEKDGA